LDKKGEFMAIVLDGEHLTIEKLIDIARYNAKVEIAPASIERVKECRTMLEEKIKAREIMYGINTGIGELSEVILTDEQVTQFQKYLIYNHAAGIGDPAPIEHIRGAMAGRINVMSKGKSGCRPEIPLTYAEMLNKGVTPVVCQKGSVGACGDLAPMSQIALLLMGEGEAFYKGERLPGRVAMEKQAEIACAMTLEALLANLKPYDTRLHQARGFAGAVRSAQAIMKCIDGSDLLAGKHKMKVQDAYSMRSSPQVIGAAHDALAYARQQVEIELNGCGDNPVFFPEHNLTITGANFQGTPISLPMDMIGAAVTMVCVLSERRLNRMTNPNLSVGLPAFLTKGAGMFSGLMLSQYTADTLIVEQRILSAPASTMSIPAAADQEDFVSMGMNTALKNQQILDNAYGILGIEFMAAAQALDLRDFKPGKGVTAAKKVIREHVAHLDEDRPLYDDHNKMKELVKSCAILEAVEKDVGSHS
jgi:histidine ammonia-lyase